MAVQTPIPPNPIGENFAWRDWLQKLSDRVFGTASTLNIPIEPQYGGTGLTTYNTGDIIYSNATNNLTRLPAPASTSLLKMTAAGVPSWTASSGIVTSVTGTSPVVSSGGATPAISMPAATTSVNGYLTSTDWTTFNNKGSGTVTSVGGTGTVNGITLTGTVTSSGNLTLGGTLGGISNSQLTNSSITFGSTSQALGSTVSGITGVTIDNGAIGATTTSTGKFTTLESTGTASLATGSTTSIQIVGDASYPQIKAAGGTNTPLVLQPLGTGSLQAQKTDSSATGGNARGANAVDWQTSRGSASQVASGQLSFVGGGYANTASQYNSTVVSGYTNVVSNVASFIGAGSTNTASGQYGAIVSGIANTAAGYLNFIGGGYTNSGTSGSAVTTQSGTMNGTTAVTLSGSNASIKVGQYIIGTSIGIDTYVAAISGTSLTLSKNASGSSTSTLSFYTPHGVVVGGGNNQATGSYSFIGGGGDAGTSANRNVASGDWSTVGGGTKNVASGIGSVIAGGGTYGVTVGNTASGIGSFIGSGWGNQATNTGSSVVTGAYSLATGQYSGVFGGQIGTTRAINGYIVFPSSNAGNSNITGGAQGAILVLGRQTTDATATVLTSDTNSASGTNQVILPNNSAYYFRGEIIAGVTGAGDTKGWYIEGVIKRGVGVGTTAIVGTATVTSLYADVGASTWAVTALADTTNGGLKITVTGQASTTIRWVAQIRTTEMTY